MELTVHGTSPHQIPGGGLARTRDAEPHDSPVHDVGPRHFGPDDARPHDLLRVARPGLVLSGELSWVREILDHDEVWAVVRRAPLTDGLIPVGLRGTGRSQRWAGRAEPSAVRRWVAPEDIDRTPPPGRGDLPVFRALEAVSDTMTRWVPGNWGPGGSVGFELGTGLRAARETSDLDLLVRAERPLPLSERAYAEAVNRAGEFGVRLDVQIDTGKGAFAVPEWLRGDGVALRTPTGPKLVKDPWEEP